KDEKANESDQVPGKTAVLVGHAAHRFGANSAAFIVLGGSGTHRQCGKEQRYHHASVHGVLLRAEESGRRAARKGAFTAKRRCRQSKRPDRPAIRAPCVTIARQPPWMCEERPQSLIRVPNPTQGSRSDRCGVGLCEF